MSGPRIFGTEFHRANATPERFGTSVGTFMISEITSSSEAFTTNTALKFRFLLMQQFHVPLIRKLPLETLVADIAMKIFNVAVCIHVLRESALANTSSIADTASYRPVLRVDMRMLFQGHEKRETTMTHITFERLLVGVYN
jgi:hypothetical protein